MNEIVELGGEAVDSLIENLTSNEVIKSIPIASDIVKLISIAKNAKDMIFAKKIKQFLYELDTISQKKKVDMIKRLTDSKNTDEKRKIGETLICIIEKCDDFDKPIFIAQIFAAYIQDSISYMEFIRLCKAIDGAATVDLYDLAGGGAYKNNLLGILLKSGLSEYSTGTASGSLVTLNLKLSELGELFLECCGVENK